MLVKIDVFGCDQRHVGHSKKPAALQSDVASQVGQLSVDNVVFPEHFLLSVDVFDADHHPDCFGHQKNVAVGQAVCRL